MKAPPFIRLWIGMVSVLATMPVAWAATFNIADGDVAGLKAAMTTAATNQQSDVINLAANGTYILTTVDNNNFGPNGLPVMGHDHLVFGTDIAIHGNGATIRRDTTDGIPLFRIFQIVGGNILVQDLTIRGALNDDGAGVESFGTGTVTLLNCTFRMNEASQGGGVANHNTGTVVLTNCVFDSNQFVIQGGAIANYNGTIKITGCSFTFNTASNVGGAIYNDSGTLTIASSTFANNSSPGGGGCIFSVSSTVSISQSLLDANSTSQTGGAISSDGDQLTLTGTTLSRNSANQGGGVLYLANDTTTISSCKFTGNGSGGDGGAILNKSVSNVASTINIDHTTFSTNGIGSSVDLVSADPNGKTVRGGAISNGGAGATVTLTNCTLSNNSSVVYGAGTVYGIGIYNDSGTVILTDSAIESNTAYFYHELLGNNYGNIVFEGGGIFNNGNGEVNLTRCALDTNLLPIGGIASSEGGGVLNNNSGSVNVLNSTIAFNTANFGGGIWNNANGAINLLYCTVAHNSAGSAGGISNVSGPFSVKSSIVAFNSATGSDRDVSGNFTSNGYNLISVDQNNGFSQPTDKKGGPGAALDPKFDNNDLANNGGPTKTLGILSNSPAINSGDPNSPARDQRNFVRTNAPDIGAFEFGATLPVTIANISTRGRVETGDNVMIGGFIVTGSQAKKVVIRARGPSLPVNGPLADPRFDVYNSSNQVITTNDNWQTDPNAQQIQNLGLGLSNSLESAVLLTLSPGGYTVIVSSANGGVGIGLVEVYDVDRTVNGQLGNISTRAVVRTGDNVMIGGFIVQGSDAQKLIVRAIGPSLPLAGKLGDPVLNLYDGNGNNFASNNNWRDTQEAEIIATTIPPNNDLESAVVTTLAPGGYTAIVSGNNGTTGLALVEVYGLD